MKMKMFDIYHGMRSTHKATTTHLGHVAVVAIALLHLVVAGGEEAADDANVAEQLNQQWNAKADQERGDIVPKDMMEV